MFIELVFLFFIFLFFSSATLILQTHVNFVGPMWLGCFMAVAGLYSVDHRMQYHPSCVWIIISRMSDSNSLHCHQPFPHTNINLHRKWNCSIARTGSHRTLGVICLEVSAEIKNIWPITLFLLHSNISPCHYSLPVMCWSSVWRSCVHSSDLRLGSWMELWVINFIQVFGHTRWKHNLHDCCSKSVLHLKLNILKHLYFFLFNSQEITVWLFAMLYIFPVIFFCVCFRPVNNKAQKKM